MKIAVVGTGYVGLVTGTCLSEVGHLVTCVDIDENKIKCLRQGKSPIYEPGLTGLIARNLEHERLTFTTDLGEALEGATVCFIAVGTPEDKDGSADLRFVEQVARNIGKQMRENLLVIVKSTVPVGTCDIVEKLIREELKDRGVGFGVAVASNPEFLKEGKAIEDCMKPDRIVVGLDTVNDESRQLFSDMYEPFVRDDPAKIMYMNRKSSELTKYGANAMLATRISFMNEMALLCDATGANIDDVRRGIGSDPRIGKKFLYAGPGYGGSCFPKDVAALVKTGAHHDVELKVLTSVQAANHHQKQLVTKKISRHFDGQLRGKKIAVWGLAFKPGTDDVRDTPALTIIKGLIAEGATVAAHDPQARANFAQLVPESSSVKYVNKAYDALQDADAVVLVTEWSEYQRPNWDKVARLMRTKTVFDFRNQYLGSRLIESGFAYVAIGRGHLQG